MSWVFLGNLSHAISQWLVLIILTHLGSAEILGEYVLGLTLSTPLMLVANLGLRQLQGVDVARQFKFADYLGTRLITTSLACMGVLVIVLLSGYSQQTSFMICCVLAIKTVESISDMYHGFFQKHESMQRSAQATIIRCLLSTACLYFLLLLTENLYLAMLGSVLSWLISLYACDLPLVRKLNAQLEKPESLGIRFRWSAIRSVMWHAAPIGILSAVIALDTHVPRYVISLVGELKVLGQYAAMIYFATAITIVFAAIARPITTRLAMYEHRKQRREYNRLVLGMLGLGSLLGLLGIVVAIAGKAQIVFLVYGIEFMEQADLLPWIMLAAMIQCQSLILNAAIIASRLTKWQVPLSCLISLFSIPACWWIIPTYGLKGAVGLFVLQSLIRATLAASIVLFRHRLEGVPCPQ